VPTMKTNNTIITKVFIKVFGDGEKYEESKGEKKGIVLAISQQKKSATGVAHWQHTHRANEGCETYSGGGGDGATSGGATGTEQNDVEVRDEDGDGGGGGMRNPSILLMTTTLEVVTEPQRIKEEQYMKDASVVAAEQSNFIALQHVVEALVWRIR
jgi:hypothetical protein